MKWFADVILAAPYTLTDCCPWSSESRSSASVAVRVVSMIMMWEMEEWERFIRVDARATRPHHLSHSYFKTKQYTLFNYL